jgi:hypothetical protein
MKSNENLCARFVGVKFDVVTNPVRGKEAVDGARGEQFVAYDLLQQFLGVGEKLAGFLAVTFVIQDRGVTTPQFPV